MGYEIYPLAFIAALTVAFLYLAKKKEEKEERRREKDGGYACMGRFSVWEGPLPPRPKGPPPAGLPQK